MVQYQLFFTQRFKGRVLFNVPMSDHTSFRIGGTADVMAFPRDEADLRDLVAFCEAKGFAYYVLGGGTNILVRDGGIRGIVINMADGFKGIDWVEPDRAVVEGGVTLAGLLAECAERGLGGLEFAAGIPGTVGGAVVMNAGAYGGAMADVVEGVEIIRRKGKRGFLGSEDLRFGYRTSEVPAGAVVVRAHMRFTPRDPEEVRERIAGMRERRGATARITYPNAGSVFRNPEGAVAGKLIEEAGMKGERVGGAMVSEVHANYIVNTGGATAADVLALMASIRDRVYSATGVVLEPEIKVLGED